MRKYGWFDRWLCGLHGHVWRHDYTRIGPDKVRCRRCGKIEDTMNIDMDFEEE